MSGMYVSTLYSPEPLRILPNMNGFPSSLNVMTALSFSNHLPKVNVISYFVFLDISLILFGSPDCLVALNLFPVVLSLDKTVGVCGLLWFWLIPLTHVSGIRHLDVLRQCLPRHLWIKTYQVSNIFLFFLLEPRFIVSICCC
jgi:hypothetical protein